MAVTRKQVCSILVLTLVTYGVSLIVFLSGGLGMFELKAFDLFSRRLNPLRSPGDIVIVQIDQVSIDALSSEGVTWPWPRQVYAPLFDYLAAADGVFVDILFTEPSSYGVDDDVQLAEGLKKAGNVYLPVFLTSAQKELAPADRRFLSRIALPPGGASPRLTYASAIVPIGPLQPVARGGGNVMIKPDPDGVYRRVPLIFGLGGEVIPHFVLGHLLARQQVQQTPHGFSLQGAPLPLRDDNLVLRFYRGKQPFPTISASAVLGSYLDREAGRKPAIPPDYFRGKKVFLGLTAAGLYDLKPIAVSAVSTGVLVHATTLDNLLHRNYLRQLEVVWVAVFMFALSLTACWFILTHNSLLSNLAFFSVASAVTVALPASLFYNCLYLQFIPLLLAFFLSTTATAAFSYATEGKERRFVRRAFAQYMDETIVAHLLKNPDLIKPGGQRRRVTVFFADIAGFTSISEKLAPEETARILHTILNGFTEVVIANRGVIDKYIGDCVMAFWGAPLDSAEDECNACRAALQCMATLEEINRGFAAEGYGNISMRIGIHSGDAIVGNLGSDRLFDYTVVGDTVNLASRLEGANKQFATRIMVSEATLQRTAGEFLSRELGLIEVKGKSQPVRIYELVSASAGATREQMELVRSYGEAYDLFRNGCWGEAAARFAALLGHTPADGPSAYYRKWCEALAENPPLTDDWNVIRMTEK